VKQIAAPQLAVDRHIKQREIAMTICEFKAHTNRPHMLWLRGKLLSHETAFVPSRMASTDGGQVLDGHGRHSISYAANAVSCGRFQRSWPLGMPLPQVRMLGAESSRNVQETLFVKLCIHGQKQLMVIIFRACSER